MQFCEDLTTTKAVVRTTEKWRPWESKEGRQRPIYQQLRSLRERQFSKSSRRDAPLGIAVQRALAEPTKSITPLLTTENSPYGPKTRSAASQVQPRVTSPSETSELESASVPETPRIKQETPKPWTRRIAPACQPFMTDASVAAVMTAWLDRAGEAGHCWFILPATEISRKRNGSRHFDIGSSHYRRRQGLSPAVSDRSSFRAIREPQIRRRNCTASYSGTLNVIFLIAIRP